MITKSHFVSELMLNKMKELGLTQRALSEKMGWRSNDGQSVSNMIRGKCQLPVKSIKKLSLAINVPVQDIINEMVRDYVRCVEKEIYGDKDESN